MSNQEQIKLDFCYQEKGGNLISVGSAFDYSGLGVSHYSYNDLGLIKRISGIFISFLHLFGIFSINLIMS